MVYNGRFYALRGRGLCKVLPTRHHHRWTRSSARLAAAQGAGELTQVLAGGTDLLVQMKQGQRTPGLILDIKRVGETQTLAVDGDTLTIGASVPAAKAKAFPLVAKAFPGLAHAIDLIGSSQIQGRASLGGNLCNASPAGDTIPALIANGFEAQILTADGLRSVPVEAFVTGVGKNALASGEVLLALKGPVPGARSGAQISALRRARKWTLPWWAWALASRWTKAG